MRFAIDTSAAVKLATSEPESAAMRAFVGRVALCASDLLAVELRRAMRRLGRQAADVDPLLSRITLIEQSPTIRRMAGVLDPTSMRTLDAIHLATALHIRDDIDGLICYDARLCEAAAFHGLPVFSPA